MLNVDIKAFRYTNPSINYIPIAIKQIQKEACMPVTLTILFDSLLGVEHKEVWRCILYIV